MQPKAIAYPVSSRLYNRRREMWVRLAAKHGIKLRQSYQRLAKRSLRLANRYAHARQMPLARREIKGLKTFSAAWRGDIGRKLAVRPGLVSHFAEAPGRVNRLRTTDHTKLYALHAPEVAWLAKACPCGEGRGQGTQARRARRQGLGRRYQSRGLRGWHAGVARPLLRWPHAGVRTRPNYPEKLKPIS